MSQPDPSNSPPDGRPAEAPDALFAAVYERLKAMAGKRLAGEASATLQTTAVVHELYLRMHAAGELRFSHRAQFFAYAARALRHLLKDRARDRLRLKAGHGWVAVTLESDDLPLALASAEETLALDAALSELAALDARAAQVVELRYFAGLSLEDVAESLGLARRTVDRDWRFARAFLHERLD
nr:ECF-type sigma factor [Aquimonas voraii]